MKVSTRYKSSRIPCPKCGEYYLQNAYGKENKTFVKVGEYCPGCDYIKRTTISRKIKEMEAGE